VAAVLTVLRTLRLLLKREFGSFLSVRLNNLFLFAALLAYTSVVSGMRPIAAIPFLLLLLLMMLFPLSSDHFAKIPSSRKSLWPLTDRQWTALRLAALAFNPVLWLAILVLLATRRFIFAGSFLAVAVAVQAVSTAGTRLTARIPQLHPYRYVPQFPGTVGGLVGQEIREILSILDFYAALLFSIATVAYRGFSSHPQPEANPVLAMLAALALSTYTQCSFSLNSSSGISRYRLLPLRGWQILSAKDVAFLGILLLLTLPSGSGMIAGLTFGFTVVAVGRYPSLVLRPPRQRWRFASGDLRFSVLQFVAAPALGFAASRTSIWFFVLAIVLYLVSLFVGGWYWDKSAG
jgi:hypothetical protein